MHCFYVSFPCFDRCLFFCVFFPFFRWTSCRRTIDDDEDDDGGDDMLKRKRVDVMVETDSDHEEKRQETVPLADHDNDSSGDEPRQKENHRAESDNELQSPLTSSNPPSLSPTSPSFSAPLSSIPSSPSSTKRLAIDTYDDVIKKDYSPSKKSKTDDDDDETQDWD